MNLLRCLKAHTSEGEKIAVFNENSTGWLIVIFVNYPMFSRLVILQEMIVKKFILERTFLND